MSSGLPLISIVTISFNQFKYLPAAMSSVLSNGLVNLEYIVVDPGSTDGSREFIARYAESDKRVIPLFERDEGPADGLNNGLARVSAPIVGFLNADDLYLPGALETAVLELSKNPSVAAIYGHGAIIDSRSQLVRRFRSHHFSLEAFLSGTGIVVQQATFFRTSALRHISGFNVANTSCWDGEAVLDLALAGEKLRPLNDYLGLFRIYETSITGSGRLAEVYRSDQNRMAKKVLTRYPGLTAPSMAYGRMQQFAIDPLRLLLGISDRVLEPGRFAWMDGWPGIRTDAFDQPAPAH